jgi:DNA-binding transcriptional LysR family regulator
MDTEQIRTFMAVAAHGSFLEAAARIHVTQSTVSARIQSLEGFLGARLFSRNRDGAVLTAAGERFVRHAKTLLRTLDQAKHDVGLPSRYSATLTVGARIALWYRLLPRWAAQMRWHVPDVSMRSEIGFEEDLMRRVVDGSMDMALMYTPQFSVGVQVDHLFDENLILLSDDPGYDQLDDRYVYVDWGPAFYAQHSAAYPELERPAMIANIGWLGLQLILHRGGACFVPERVAQPYLASGRLHRVADSPEFRLPTYVVYPLEGTSAVLRKALALLPEAVARQYD